MTADIREYTTNYLIPLPRFDAPRWHDYYYQAMRTIDGLLYALSGATGLRGVWDNSTSYAVGDRVLSNETYLPYVCLVNHTSRSSGDLSDDIAAHPTYWQSTSLVPRNRGDWATATFYYANEIVTEGTTTYICNEQHTSTVFATDLAAGKWEILFELTGAMSADGAALVSAANYAAMRALLDLEAGTDFYSIAAANAAFQPLDADLTAIAALTTTSTGRSLLAIADAAAGRTILSAQAASAVLSTYAGINPSADVQTLLGSADLAAIRTFLAYTTANVAESGNLYFTDARVRASVLTGLSVATSTQVAAADSVLVGIGKLQAQIGKSLEISGLKLENDITDATNDIKINTGRCWDSTGTVPMVLSSSLIKQLDATFAAGTNAGMRHTTAIANGTYHLWLVSDANGGNVDVFAGTNANDPSGEGSFPAGYKYRYIGSILRESGAIVSFEEFQGGLFHRDTVGILNTPTPFSWTQIYVGVPIGFQVRPHVQLLMSAGSFAVHDVYWANYTRGYQKISLSGNSQNFGSPFAPTSMTDASGLVNVMWNRVAGSGGNLVLQCFGWTNPRLLNKVF